MEALIRIVGAIVVIADIIFAACLFAFPIKWLWNWLMPTIFGLKTITVWQAWGLMVLSGFLLRSSSTTESSS